MSGLQKRKLAKFQFSQWILKTENLYLVFRNYWKSQQISFGKIGRWMGSSDSWRGGGGFLTPVEGGISENYKIKKIDKSKILFRLRNVWYWNIIFDKADKRVLFLKWVHILSDKLILLILLISIYLSIYLLTPLIYLSI